MAAQHLIYKEKVPMAPSTMLLALTGWMDGGDVSTGTIKHVMENCEAREFAHIESDPFYIFNFPGSMEVAALFRPEVKYRDGLIRGEMDMPQNTAHCDPAAKLVFFIGAEPNLRWQGFADCIFDLAAAASVNRIVFIGSFGGTVPHTREPRMFGSASHSHLLPLLKDYGCRPSQYKGPASFATMLLAQAAAHNLEMISLVAEIPGYLQGTNPLSIEAVARRLARMTNQRIDIDGLRQASNTWETQVTAAVEKNAELAETVRKLEEQYDTDLIENTAHE